MFDPRQQTLLSMEAFRRLVGATSREIEDLIAARVIEEPEAGHVGLVQGVTAYLARLREAARNATLSGAALAAKDARAEASELALAVARRDLVDDEEAEAASDFLAGVIVSQIAGLPARATRDLRARAAMQAALRRAQAGIADDLAKLTR